MVAPILLELGTHMLSRSLITNMNIKTRMDVPLDYCSPLNTQKRGKHREIHGCSDFAETWHTYVIEVADHEYEH